MKKFVKACAVVAVIFLALGLGLYYLGSKGVDNKTVSDVVDKVSKGVVNLDLNFADWSDEWAEDSAIYDIDESDAFSSGYPVFSGDVEKYQVTDKKVGKIKLELGGCAFVIEDSMDGNVYLEGENVGKLQVYEEAGVLYVKSLRDAKSANSVKDSEIILYLPETSYEDIKVSLGAGSVEFDGLAVESMEISLGAGEVDGSGLIAKKLKAEVGAGAVTLEDVNVETVDVEVSIGQCVIDGEISKKVDANCVMGNITLDLSGEVTDYNYEYSSVFGMISLDGVEITNSGEKKINNGAAKDIELECTMGNIKVDFQKNIIIKND